MNLPTIARRCSAIPAIVAIATLLPLAGIPSVQAGDTPLFHDDFQDQFDTASLGEKYNIPEKMNNQWTLTTSGGADMSVGASSPGGQVLPLVSKQSFPGFRTHPVISVSVDTQLGTRLENGLPFGLPTEIALVSNPEDATSVVAGFTVGYVPETFGTNLNYEISVAGTQSKIWEAAPAFEGFQQDPNGATATGWFRWRAVFSYEAASGQLQTTVSVANIGEEGSASPALIQKWEFPLVTLAQVKRDLPLFFGVNGRGREGLGVRCIDNIIVRSIAPTR